MLSGREIPPTHGAHAIAVERKSHLVSPSQAGSSGRGESLNRPRAVAVNRPYQITAGYFLTLARSLAVCGARDDSNRLLRGKRGCNLSS